MIRVRFAPSPSGSLHTTWRRSSTTSISGSRTSFASRRSPTRYRATRHCGGWMRLYSTSHRRKVELPDAPAPIRMYFCGPTVYQRIHVGNARPFVISMWLRRWLAERGYDVTLVENITDINDKIYDAAPGQSAALAAQAAQWYLEDTERLGLGRPDHEPKATETIPEIVGLIEELVRGGFAYEAGGDV